jgi:hypothetical protein
MDTPTPQPEVTTSRNMDRFLAVIGAGVCIITTARVWQVVDISQTVWPLPGAYLIELVGLSLVALWGATVPARGVGSPVVWAAVGVFFAFAAMGAWSIGFLYLPVGVVFGVVALLMDRPDFRNLSAHLVVCVAAAGAQVYLMFGVIRLLSPGAIF